MVLLSDNLQVLTRRKDINFKALKQELLSNKQALIKEYDFDINEYDVESFDEIEKGINEKENILHLVTLMLYSNKADFFSILKSNAYRFIIQHMSNSCEMYTEDSYEKAFIYKKLGKKWYEENIQEWINENAI